MALFALSWPTWRTKMSHNTADHAGLKPLHLPCPTESRSQERVTGQTSTSIHRSSSLVRPKTMDAMEESHSTLSLTCTTTRSPMRLALSTPLEVTITERSAHQSLSAETATPHEPCFVPDEYNVYQEDMSSTNSAISMVPNRWCRKFTKEARMRTGPNRLWYRRHLRDGGLHWRYLQWQDRWFGCCPWSLYHRIRQDLEIASRTVFSTGPSETLGKLIGVKMVSWDSSEARATSLSRATAHGLPHSTPEPTRRSMWPPTLPNPTSNLHWQGVLDAKASETHWPEDERKPEIMAIGEILLEDMPAAWDLRAMGAEKVNYLSWNKSQHIPLYCGSCWSQETTSSIADRFNIMLGDQSATPVALSAQVVVNCHVGGDCSGGEPGSVYSFAFTKGFPDSSCEQYTAHNLVNKAGTCEPIHICRDRTWLFRVSISIFVCYIFSQNNCLRHRYFVKS